MVPYIAWDSPIWALVIVGGILIAIMGQIIMFIIYQKKRYKRMEENLHKNAMEVISKMDYLEEILKGSGGKKMDVDLKKVAKFLAKKIEEAKEDILVRIDDLAEENKEEEAAKPEEDLGEEESSEVDLDEYDELEDYQGERKVSTKQEVPKKK